MATGILAFLANGGDMDDAVNQEALRFAVSRAVQCPYCGSVLDVRTSVLVEIDGKPAVLCASCWGVAEPSVTKRCADNGWTLNVTRGGANDVLA